jgi:hypothetical protein
VPAPPTMPFVDEQDLPVWPVPLSIRREQGLGQGGPTYVKFLSLAELFASQDGEKLAELFDTDGEFRYVVASIPRPRSTPPILTHFSGMPSGWQCGTTYLSRTRLAPRRSIGS